MRFKGRRIGPEPSRPLPNKRLAKKGAEGDLSEY